ncbi:MAG: DUF4118 domain-containing protein, partial [Thermobispora bispora]|nr:DUF4118 domain-containing protein [Thermobispora bispora]
MRARLLSSLLRVTRPPLLVGVIVGVVCVTAETLLALLLARVAPTTSLDLVYLLGVLLVSYLWGLPLGLMMALASGLAYDLFLVSPADRVTLFTSWSWITLLIFLVVALLVSGAAALLRMLLIEADECRCEADVSASTARLLLRADHLSGALPVVARRLEQDLGLPSLAIEFGPAGDDRRGIMLPLSDEGTRFGSLIVPADLPQATLRRLRERVVPSLEAALAAARAREAVAHALAASRDQLARVAEEQSALRRVATLVARGVRPTEIFGAVAREMGLIVKADHTAIERYEPDRTVVLMGSWSASSGGCPPPVGMRRPLHEEGLSALVLRTGQLGVITADEGAAGELGRWARDEENGVAIGSPIVVEGRLW